MNCSRGRVKLVLGATRDVFGLEWVEPSEGARPSDLAFVMSRRSRCSRSWADFNPVGFVRTHNFHCCRFGYEIEEAAATTLMDANWTGEGGR